MPAIIAVPRTIASRSVPSGACGCEAPECEPEHRYSSDFIKSRISSDVMWWLSADDTAILQEEQRIGDGGGAGIVRDHDDRLVQLLDRPGAGAPGSRRRSSNPGCRLARRRRSPRVSTPGPGRWRRAAAGRRRAPPGGDSSRSARPTSPTRRSIQAGSGRTPRSRAAARCSRLAVSIGSRLKNWKTNPIFSRRSSVSALSSRSRDLACRRSRPRPVVGRSSPARMCMSVDLPEPDGPMIATNCPRSRSRSTPRSASTAVSPSPNRLVTPRAETTAPGCGSATAGVCATCCSTVSPPVRAG